MVGVLCLVNIREKNVIHDLNPISSKNDLEIFRDGFRMALGTKKVDYTWDKSYNSAGVTWQDMGVCYMLA